MMREKHRWAASCTSFIRMEPKTRACDLTGNQTGDLSVPGTMLSHISQGPPSLL